LAKSIMVTGAGGSPSTNFVRSLQEAPESFYLIGTDSDKYALQRAETNERYLIPSANENDYLEILKQYVEETHPDFIHAQPDEEVFQISKHRHEIGVASFLPKHETIEICQNKVESYRKWMKAGLRVPRTLLINSEEDLKQAFEEIGSKLWLREIRGAFGKGSIVAEDISLARAWIDSRNGWGKFSAARCLLPKSVTWLSIWKEGELIVAQGRERLYWEFANRSPSGVTGITGAGVTFSNSTLDELAKKAIFAIDKEPNGIFGVDLTYDEQGVPNPTEINVGRFFTTHHFFTRAGLNMPYIYVKLGLGERVPSISNKINPLTPGLCWIRGMDFRPVLTDLNHIEMFEAELNRRRKSLRN